MDISKYNDINNSSFKEAIEKIKANSSHSFEWYVVKNSMGCLFELGGRNVNNKLFIKAYIPVYKIDGTPITNNEYFKSGRSNDMVRHEYSIEHDDAFNTSAIEYPNFFVRKKLFNNIKDFLNYIDKRDFIVNPIKLENKVVRYDPVYEYDVINF